MKYIEVKVDAEKEILEDKAEREQEKRDRATAKVKGLIGEIEMAKLALAKMESQLEELLEREVPEFCGNRCIGIISGLTFRPYFRRV